MNYIFDNIKKIENTDNVLMIIPCRKDKKMYLGAFTTTGKGRYEIIPLTTPESTLSFYFEPIKYFGQTVGIFYMRNFVVMYNLIAFNKKYLKGFDYTNILNKPQKFNVFARFCDGSHAYIMQDSKANFNKKTINILSNLLNDNKSQIKHVPYEKISQTTIDEYMVDNKAVIHSLANDVQK